MGKQRKRKQPLVPPVLSADQHMTKKSSGPGPGADKNGRASTHIDNPGAPRTTDKTPAAAAAGAQLNMMGTTPPMPTPEAAYKAAKSLPPLVSVKSAVPSCLHKFPGL